MKLNTLLTLSTLILPLTSHAFGQKEYSLAKGVDVEPTTSINLSTTKFQTFEKTNIVPLSTSYLKLNYMGVNEASESDGGSFTLGYGYNEYELSVSYSDFDAYIQEYSINQEFNIDNLSVKFLVPLVSAENYLLHLGAKYDNYNISDLGYRNDSASLVLNIRSHISNSFIVNGFVDYNVSDKSNSGAYSDLSLHEPVTVGFEADYYPNDKLSVGFGIKFGSEITSQYHLGLGYHF